MTDVCGVARTRVKLPQGEVAVRIKGRGTPVLMLHGGGPGTSSEDWIETLSRLPEGILGVALDFPGFGESDVPQDLPMLGHPAFVGAALSLMDALCLQRVVLVGHSMGAAVAAALAVQHPQRVAHLVVVAPGGGFYGIDDYQSAGMAGIGRAVADPGPEQLASLVALMCHEQQGQEAQVARRLKILRRPGVLEAQRVMHAGRASRTGAQKEARARWAPMMIDFAPPMTLVWGMQERFNPVELGERIVGRLPAHAHFERVPAAGHNVQCDQPDTMAQIIVRAAAGAP